MIQLSCKYLRTDKYQIFRILSPQLFFCNMFFSIFEFGRQLDMKLTVFLYLHPSTQEEKKFDQEENLKQKINFVSKTRSKFFFISNKNS